MKYFKGLIINLGVAYSIKLLLQFSRGEDVRLWKCYILAWVIAVISASLYDRGDIDAPFLTWFGFGLVGLVFGTIQLFINL